MARRSATDVFCPRRVIGSGVESVYLYYVENDRLASRSPDAWACKIGMTRGDVARRVRAQFGTARSAAPIVALDMRCDDAKSMERQIHAHLSRGGYGLAGPDGVGREWFETSPAVVEQLFLRLLGDRPRPATAWHAPLWLSNRGKGAPRRSAVKNPPATRSPQMAGRRRPLLLGPYLPPASLLQLHQAAA